MHQRHSGKMSEIHKTAVTSLTKLPRRFQQRTTILAAFAMILGELRFVVERVDVRWPTLHAKKDDSFGTRGKMRCLGRQRIVLFACSSADS